MYSICTINSYWTGYQKQKRNPKHDFLGLRNQAQTFIFLLGQECFRHWKSLEPTLAHWTLSKCYRVWCRLLEKMASKSCKQKNVVYGWCVQGSEHGPGRVACHQGDEPGEAPLGSPKTRSLVCVPCWPAEEIDVGCRSVVHTLPK